MLTVLETDRLRLRTWSLDDVPAVFEIYRDPEVTHFLQTKVHTPDDARIRIERNIERMERKGLCLWAVVVKESGQLIGACGLKHLEDIGDIEVGYHLARWAWNKGYATEAARACLAYGFEQVKLPMIVAVVNPLNFASQRVLEKCGMKYERMGRYYDTDCKVYVAHASDNLHGREGP
jgi:ribosomal-protein-alanine N-acetyltransferase